MKKKCAKAAIAYISNGMTIGLGGGRTIAHLIDYIKEENLDVKVVTPSFDTELLCVQQGLHIVPTHSVSHVDVAFDGCNEVDSNFFALKTGGGIHTREKIIGEMADEYIILADEEKYCEQLAFNHPIVVEIVKDAYASVCKQIHTLGGTTAIRSSGNKDGGILSDQGLLLVEATFNQKDVKDVKQLYEDLIRMVGVLEVSLFISQITKVLIAKENEIEVKEKH